MKRNLFIALLLLLTIESKAQTEVLNVSGATTGTWTAPASGGPFYIRITARGSDGGTVLSFGTTLTGGEGATMSGIFTVQNGETIFAVSSSKGGSTTNSSQAGGGGAGSGAVNSTTGIILLIAAGGSGAFT